MFSLRPIHTLRYPLSRSLSSSSKTTSPILSSIVAQRPSTLTSTPSPSQLYPQSASLHTTSMLCSAASSSHGGEHEDQYDPPTGWLFGIPPGEKYQNEGWERIWVWGFWGSLGVAVVAYAYKPDSSYVLSISYSVVPFVLGCGLVGEAGLE